MRVTAHSIGAELPNPKAPRVTVSSSFAEGKFMPNIFRRSLIAAALTMVSCAAFAQVRIITPDSEHLYGADPRAPGQLPDDETLRLQNERADRARIERIENA